MAVVSLGLVVPTRAGQRESRLTRLERKVGEIADNVGALEAALGGGTPSSSRPAASVQTFGGRSGASASVKDRIRRLERRVARLDGRVATLEEALSPNTQAERFQEPSGGMSQPETEARSLKKLEGWLKQLERRVVILEEILPTVTPSPSPTPSPTGDPSGEAPPGGSPSPSSAPSPSPSPPGPTCQGVQVAPGADLQALIDANPKRTTFCFAQGLYRLSDTIDTGSRFPTLDLRTGAVIDGQNGGFIGIGGPDPPADQPGTVILGGVFQHFGNASSPIWVSPVIVRRNGVVDGTEFRDNFNSGLTVQGDNARVVRVYIHHNGRYGLNVTSPCIGCPGPTGVIIEDSEIAFNNTRRLSTLDDAGGTKFLGSDGMIVRRNEVHDNYGSGLWWDSANKNAQVYGNVVYDNRNWGILYELGYGGTKIHDNTLTNNGLGDGTANWGANVQLLISTSDGSVGAGIEIYGNTIDGAAYPLGLLNHSSGTPRTRQVYVHDNVMTLRAPTTRVGAVAFEGSTELFGAAAGNRFDHNTYRVLDLGGAYWAWNGQTLTWSQWQALGLDVNGTRELSG
jgi:hypothetical protein